MRAVVQTVSGACVTVDGAVIGEIDGPRAQHLSSSSGYFLAFALAWLAFITIVNILGLDAGKWLNNACTLGSTLPIAILLGFRLRRAGAILHR